MSLSRCSSWPKLSLHYTICMQRKLSTKMYFCLILCLVLGYHTSLSRVRLVFSTRQHICYSALYAIARPSVRPSVCLSVCLSVPLSVTRVDQSKTFEVRITQPSPQSSPMTLVSWRRPAPWNSNGKIGSGGAKYDRGMKNTQFSANKSPYLRNGAR